MSNTRRLARSIGVDVSTDDATYLNLPGRVDNAPQLDPNAVDATDVDTDGFTSAEVTLISGNLVAKYNSLIDSGTPNPAQELVEACVGQFGDSARLYVRWYDKDGGTRGYKARAIVKVQYSSTGVGDLRQVTVTFQLDGTVTKMTAGEIATAIGNADVPVVTSVTPAGVGTGGLVTIKGDNFTGASAVKINAIAMTHYEVISDSVISAVLPSDAAATVPVVVTTAAGTSTGFNYARGA
jgi:hypothetical protein